MNSNALRVFLLAVVFGFQFSLGVLPVQASATLIQQNNAGGAGTTNPFTISVSFSSNVASGDAVAVGLQYDASQSSILSVTDALSSSYTQEVTATNTIGAAIYDATLASSGADAVTAHFSLACAGCSEGVAIYIFEVSGVTTAGATTGPGSGFGTAISTSPTAFQNGAFLLGMIGASCTGVCTITGGSGFTPVSANVYSAAEYATSGVSSPTTFPATINIFPGTWAEVGLALNPSITKPQYYPVGGVMLPSFGFTVLLPWVVLLSLLGFVSVKALRVKRRAKRR